MLLLIFILCALGFIGMWSVVMILPSIETEFQISRSSVTIPYVLTMFGFGVGNIIVGKLIAKVSKKTVALCVQTQILLSLTKSNIFIDFPISKK